MHSVVEKEWLSSWNGIFILWQDIGAGLEMGLLGSGYFRTREMFSGWGQRVVGANGCFRINDSV